MASFASRYMHKYDSDSRGSEIGVLACDDDDGGATCGRVGCKVRELFGVMEAPQGYIARTIVV